MDETIKGTQDNLTIWGGACKAADLETFLNAWAAVSTHMPWRIWEWVSKITFEHSTAIPENLKWLERGRLFGEGGDLSLRRDGAQVYWHFVGEKPQKLPDGFVWASAENKEARFRVFDYWQAPDNAARELTIFDRKALLWGQELRDAGQQSLGVWQDDRISGVEALVYQQMSGQGEAGRVQLCYREYVSGGNVEAVWWLGLEGWEA